MVAYTNDLRLSELATGEGSGTWGNTTNTNLELIAEAFSFGTEAITTNADTHTTTIADGSTDPGRSLFLKYTGTLDSTCTITIGPNTVSKLWFIENATSGSQSIIIKQGSGATVTIANGQTKAIYSDGAGSGGAMVDAFQDLSVPDLFVDDDLTIGDDLVLSSDSAVITFGADGDTTLTHTDGSGLTLNSTNKIMFNDASQFIQGSSATVLSLGATDEIDLTATAIDVNGTLDVSGTTAFGAAVTITETGAGSSAGPFLNLHRDSSSPADSDLIGIIQFQGEDDGSNVTAYGTIAGKIADVTGGTEDGVLLFNVIAAGSSLDALTLSHNEAVFNNGSADYDFRVESNNQTHAFFVDAGNDRVGIFQSSPASALDVAGVVTSDGLTVAGTATITTADNTTTLNLISTDTDANAGPHLRLSRNVTGADSDALGQVEFAGRDDAGNDFLFAQIEAYIVDASNGSEDGYLEIFRGVGGTERVSAMILSPTDTVFNENSGDIDFRVESNGNANMLFVDGGENRVGVGISPTETLHVDGRSRIQNLYLGEISSNFDLVQATSSAGLYLVAGTSNVTLGTSGFIFNEGSADRDFRVESDGNANMLHVDAGLNAIGIGTTGQSGVLLYVDAPGSTHAAVFRAESTGFAPVIVDNTSGSGTRFLVSFRASNTEVGNIQFNGSAVLYNTSSDQRLKDNIVDAPSASNDIDAIQVRSFDWKVDGSHQKYGMVAQELQSVAPEAVSGDADSDDMMGVDYSKLVPMLVKEIQSLRARVAQLESN
ncbi:MAG: hypothetical protein GWP37_12030 [Gammaproteobacteria bacterium]|jgi:hypothetical protein|nr:hypothetical protein [Gammaproteobacteria bacterium]